MSSPTYTLIARNTLSTNTAFIEFTSIPSTYTDLVLKCSTRSTNAGTFSDSFYVYVNSSSATVNSDTILRGNGSTASSVRFTSNNFIQIDNMDSAGNTANTFSSQEFYFPKYSSTGNKPISGINAMETNASAAYIQADAILWTGTTAISSLFLSFATGNLASDSTFYLYGIKNA